jgi:predicted lipoprotein with Yx(FWY)xxD motif
MHLLALAVAAAASVGTHSSAYGTILSDGPGRALYIFTRDGHGASRCYGACAKAWPPLLLTRGTPRAVRGAKPSLLGSVRRKGGVRQVTYRGRPVYYYVGDRKPGQVLCQGVFEYGGRWLVVRASGKAVR